MGIYGQSQPFVVNKNSSHIHALERKNIIKKVQNSRGEKGIIKDVIPSQFFSSSKKKKKNVNFSKKFSRSILSHAKGTMNEITRDIKKVKSQ